MGLLSALFILLLAFTGVLLNHGHQLGLDRGHLPNFLASVLYGVEPPALASFPIGELFFSQIDGKRLYLDEQHLGDCAGQLIGALRYRSYVVVACSDELLLFLASGELVDRLASQSPVEAFGFCADQAVCWQREGRVLQLDPDTMAVTATPADLIAVKHTQTPMSLAKKISNDYGSSISWERVVQDLHSGRLVGTWGPWLMDLMAIVFTVIAITGVIMWSLGRGRRG